MVIRVQHALCKQATDSIHYRTAPGMIFAQTSSDIMRLLLLALLAASLLAVEGRGGELAAQPCSARNRWRSESIRIRERSSCRLRSRRSRCWHAG